MKLSDTSTTQRITFRLIELKICIFIKSAPPLAYQTNCTITLSMYPLRTRELKLRFLIINKDEHKLLARKNGNENPIWSWNYSGATVSHWAHIYALITWLTINGNSCCLRLNSPSMVGT